MLNGLSLFSGIGGIDVALSDYIQPVAYCEIDPYCQSVLLSRMQAGDLPKAPIWDDIKTLSYRRFPDGFIQGNIDIIYGGFPCTDISIAGLGAGLEGKQSGLFFEIMRLEKEIRPRWLFLENVPALTHRGGVQVLEELAKASYDVRWCVISAASVGALHKRERIFILAHSESKGLHGLGGVSERTKKAQSMSTGCCENDSNSACISLQQKYSDSVQKCKGGKTWGRDSREYWPYESRANWQEVVSTMGRCTDGIPHRVERLKALGNAVVPQQVRKAFKILLGI